MEDSLINKLTYELIKISVSVNDGNVYCTEVWHGHFSWEFEALAFIRKHNHDEDCFFVLRAWVLNPTHGGQCEDFLYESTYDCRGELWCKNGVHHFVVNFNEFGSSDATCFKGRGDCRLSVGEVGWYYDRHAGMLVRCEVGALPLNTTECAGKGLLEWYDDSYVVYPLPRPTDGSDNHRHVLSCYVFTDDFVRGLIGVHG